jgi:glyoxylase-like metal-dependent hydrolase (beta-lactamase superfamily II)
VAFPRFTSPPPFEAEIITEEDLDLSDNYGVEGKIIATPGHTGGSQSVIIGNTLIAGDTFLNIQSGLVFPHFVEDPAQLLKTWQKLFDLGIKEVYPGHGAKFRIERAYDDFEKWKKILGKTNRE